MEALNLSQMSDMERLALAQECLASLKAEAKQWQDEYDSCLERVLKTAVFKEDKFLQAIKRKGDSYREGNLKLIRKPTTRRTVRRDEFVAAYPDIFLRIGTVPIREAEATIGKGALDAICDRQTAYSYELIDLGVA